MAWLNLTNTDQPYTQYQSGRPQQGAFNSYNVATSTANAAIPPYSSYHLPMMSHPKETMLTYVGQGQPNGYRHHNGGSFTPFVNRHEALPYDNMDQMSNWSQRYWYMPGLSGEHMAGGEGTIRPRHSPPKQRKLAQPVRCIANSSQYSPYLAALLVNRVDLGTQSGWATYPRTSLSFAS